jgi:hypothetical protein
MLLVAIVVIEQHPFRAPEKSIISVDRIPRSDPVPTALGTRRVMTPRPQQAR